MRSLFQPSTKNHQATLHAALNSFLAIQVNQSKDYPEPDLHRAVSRNDKSHIQKLLSQNIDINRQNDSGETALHIAARHGYSEIVELLLSHGANPNIKDTMEMWGLTPLHQALISRNEVTSVILLKHPRSDLSIRDNSGQTALEYAREENLNYFEFAT